MAKKAKASNQILWHQAFQRMEPFVVKITTPSASGTGFIVALSPNKGLVGIATAAHVIDYPHYWEQPIRIEHFKSGKTIFLNPADRFIETNAAKDTASIVVKRGDFPVGQVLPTISETKHLKVGVSVGWVGFPAIAPSNLCFFSGSISSWDQDNGFYFVDGVAINGVSGGPAFSINNTDNEVQVIGVVSAYVPNRATGIALPGLCVIRDVAPLQTMIKGLKNLEEAKKQEKTPETPPPAPSPASSEPTRG